MQHSKQPSGLNLTRLKILAAIRFAKLLAITKGMFCLILATITAAIMTVLFHLNGPVCFAGSLVGSMILMLFGLPWKTLWRSQLATIYQQEACWDLADELVFNECGTTLENILQDKQVNTEITQPLRLALSQALLIFIRKGDNRKALKIATTLHRCEKESTQDYHSSTLASLNISLGRYNEGLAMLKANLAKLESEGGANSPPRMSTLLGLISSHIQLHKFDEARKYLQSLKEIADHPDNVDGMSRRDQIVRTMVMKEKTDRAWYFFFLGRLLSDTREENAELAFESALDIMRDERLQKVLTLMYPEILAHIAMHKLSLKQYEDAEKFALQAKEYYQSKTRYVGYEFWRNVATIAFLQMQQGKNTSQALAQMEEVLSKLQQELEPTHPYIATHLVQLSDCYLADKKIDNAREALEKAMEIRTSLFNEDDFSIAEVKQRLASLQAEV